MHSLGWQVKSTFSHFELRCMYFDLICIFSSNSTALGNAMMTYPSVHFAFQEVRLKKLTLQTKKRSDCLLKQTKRLVLLFLNHWVTFCTQGWSSGREPTKPCRVFQLIRTPTKCRKFLKQTQHFSRTAECSNPGRRRTSPLYVCYLTRDDAFPFSPTGGTEGLKLNPRNTD